MELARGLRLRPVRTFSLYLLTDLYINMGAYFLFLARDDGRFVELASLIQTMIVSLIDFVIDLLDRYL